MLISICSVFQAEMMSIYRVAQWVLVNNAPFTCVSIFSGSQAAIKSFSGFMNNFRSVRKYRRGLDLLSRRITSVSLVWGSGHYNIPGNSRADKLASAGVFLPESSSIELDVPLAFIKLDGKEILSGCKHSWLNEESCSTAKLTWPLMNRRRTVQLFGLDSDIISMTFAMLTVH